MRGAIGCFILAAVFAVGILGLLIDWAWRRVSLWREREALRIRDEQLRRYNITPFFGTKERQP